MPKRYTKPGTAMEDWAGETVDRAMSNTLTGRNFGAWSCGFGEGDRARKLRLKEERAAAARRRRADGNRERSTEPVGADRN